MAEKLTKASVNYRKSNGTRRCGNCSMFRAPNSCTLVRGQIFRGDLCDRWAGRS